MSGFLSSTFHSAKGALSAGPTPTERKPFGIRKLTANPPALGSGRIEGPWADRVWGRGWRRGLCRSGGQGAPLSHGLTALGVWPVSGAAMWRGRGWRPPWGALSRGSGSARGPRSRWSGGGCALAAGRGKGPSELGGGDGTAAFPSCGLYL